MKTVIKNMTPHSISILDDENQIICEFEPVGLVRAKAFSEKVGELSGIPLVKTSFGELNGLPEYQEGVYYIVSAIAANAAMAEGRRVDDLLLVSDTVRNEQGQIIGCRKFAVL